jgi:hypothetical protein
MSIREVVRTATAVAVAVGLAACTGLPVTTDSNPNLSVATCYSYAFAEEHVANVDQPAAYGNPLNAQRLRAAIAANLAAKGIQAVDKSQAQCIVGYAMGTRQVFNDYYGGWGAGWGYGYGWGRSAVYGGWGWDGPMVNDETRISVDLFDAKTHQPIWHAAVSQTTYDMTGPKAEEKINAGTAAIFAKFPVIMVGAQGAPSTT